MRRALLLAAALAACPKPPTPSLPPCQPIADFTDAGLPADTVYGFADLHAHPAIERAFSGRLVWGAALDEAPNPLELPRLAGCPVETHTQPGQTAIDRAIGGQLFPEIAGIAGFAHGPVNSLGLRATPSWPNARDLIHQQMNLGSIRRAYEGGLRLLFASTTDDQVIAALLTAPNFINAFQPKGDSDYDSAKRQLELILDLVARSSDWMEVARTPADARRIILSGKLALVLSLEMNGLLAGQPEQLAHDYGARHFFPVHLIDNENGGAAALGSLFNSSGAAVSALYRPDHEPMQYMDILPSRDFPPTLGRPSRFASLEPAPVYIALADVPYATYAALCYEPEPACSSGTPTAATFTAFGQMNLRGLCSSREECLDGGRPGAQLITRMMDDGGWLIDVSHMSARAVEETTALRPGFPLIASHTDVVHLCRGSPTLPPCVDSMRAPESERNIDGEQARKVVAAGGVIGFGTGNGNFDTRAVLVARGAPLLALDPISARHACVAPAPGCESAPSFELADAGLPIERLRIETSGGVRPGITSAAPYVRVELRDPVDAGEYQRRVVMAPLTCSLQACTATVELGLREDPLAPPPLACTPVTGGGGTAPYTFDELESVTLEWLYLSGDRQCATTTKAGPDAPSWPIDAVSLEAQNASGASPLLTLGPRSVSPLAMLGGGSGQLVVYAREDRPSSAAGVRASGHLLKVSLTSGASGAPLLGASPQAVGADVCIALRTRAGGSCDGLTPPAAGDTECPSGWTSLNQRGAWPPGVTLYTFVRSAAAETDVCGVDIALIDWPEGSAPLTVDQVRIDAAEDPLAHWVRRYSELARHVAGGQLGTLAFGTDFNGLNGLTDISEYPVPASALLPSTCAAAATGPQGFAPLRFRNDDGSIGPEVRLDERGLATYGLLQDFVAVAGAYPGCGADVRDSLMLSAEATIRAWEKIVDPSAPPRPPLPVRHFACDGGL